MREPLRFIPPPPTPTPSLLRMMERQGAEDARADAEAGDWHLFQMTGRIYDGGQLHRDAWERYEAAYDREVARHTLRSQRSQVRRSSVAGQR